MSIRKRLEAGVEFSDEAADASFLGVDLQWYEFQGKSVALFAAEQSGLADYLRGQGAELVFQADQNPQLVDILEYQGTLDYAFVDPRQMERFDNVSDVSALTAALGRILGTSGVCFVVLRTGVVQTDWDVYNSILLTPEGALPSSPYLYNSLLQDFAVRPLLRVRDESNAHCVTRIFRLSPLQQTLLVILGHSQAGKTTLARNLQMLQPGAHFSSDYLYFNLFQARGKLGSTQYTERLSKILGSATAEDTGNFFRLLEDDIDALREYLSLVVGLFSSSHRIVSIDLDLRREDRIPVVRSALEAAGFSVWFVTR